MLDLATGGGDVPLGLWQRGRRAGLCLDIAGVDCSPRAVDIARQRAKQSGANVHFETMNVLEKTLPGGFDVILASLFLHHLDHAEAVGLLARMAAAARLAVLVNDLVRSRMNLLLVALGARLLTTSRVVRTDASLSVRAAFTIGELRDLARAADLHGADRAAVPLPHAPALE